MNQRDKLEHLCRYITRPAIAEERLARNKDGQVVLMLKTPYRDGTTDIVMSPLEFMQRLAALVPRPRLNLIRFHGVLAPNAKLRSEIIPGNKQNKSNVSDRNDDVPYPPASVRISWARLLKRVFDIDIEHCPYCGGTLKIIAAILESGAITKILDHLGLSPERHPEHLCRSLILSGLSERIKLIFSAHSLNALTFPLGVFCMKGKKWARTNTVCC